jgi:hypothetical protein
MRGALRLLSEKPDEAAKAYLEVVAARCARTAQAQVSLSQGQLKVVGFKRTGFWGPAHALPMTASVDIELGPDLFLVRYLILSPSPLMYAAIAGLAALALSVGEGAGMLALFIGAGFAGILYVMLKWYYRNELLSMLRHAASELRLKEV